RVVHHGVDHLPATARPPERGSGRPYLLYVGQRDGYKNFGRLLRTWAGDSVLLGEFDLLCFGGGPWSTEERAEIGRLSLPDGRLIQAHGEDAVLVGLYQNAAAFVYPSMYEGFGIPPLEAMSQGCPVLSSNVSSMPEVLGDAAEYFPPEDRDALREALHRVLGDSERRSELQARGRERAARFTWRRCAEETLAAYRVLA
ncbi:MAG: glycosyltransferase family 4 protein, partial [Gammaproteobacteria bacterium]|nr:glycosyltransferase family 4 protein [Gammaproteobacteria bacterium]